MPDRKKTIEALSKALTRVGYGDMDNVTLSEVEEAIEAAITWLKAEQEVEPVKTLGATGILWIDCRRCGGVLPKWAKYCPECGGRIKWDA